MQQIQLYARAFTQIQPAYFNGGHRLHCTTLKELVIGGAAPTRTIASEIEQKLLIPVEGETGFASAT